jgi:hypothetical protein
VQTTFGIFKMAAVAMETTKTHEKFKVLGIGWIFPEILSDMCTHNFEASKFQNGRRCHKKCEKFKVLGIGWNLIEMLYGMCINGFGAWKFQNASLL